MPHATTDDGVKLYYEEAGAGTPIIFIHEFADDLRNDYTDTAPLAPPLCRSSRRC